MSPKFRKVSCTRVFLMSLLHFSPKLSIVVIPLFHFETWESDKNGLRHCFRVGELERERVVPLAHNAGWGYFVLYTLCHIPQKCIWTISHPSLALESKLYVQSHTNSQPILPTTSYLENKRSVVCMDYQVLLSLWRCSEPSIANLTEAGSLASLTSYLGERLREFDESVYCVCLKVLLQPSTLERSIF